MPTGSHAGTCQKHHLTSTGGGAGRGRAGSAQEGSVEWSRPLRSSAEGPGRCGRGGGREEEGASLGVGLWLVVAMMLVAGISR